MAVSHDQTLIIRPRAGRVYRRSCAALVRPGGCRRRPARRRPSRAPCAACIVLVGHPGQSRAARRAAARPRDPGATERHAGRTAVRGGRCSAIARARRPARAAGSGRSALRRSTRRAGAAPRRAWSSTSRTAASDEAGVRAEDPPGRLRGAAPQASGSAFIAASGDSAALVARDLGSYVDFHRSRPAAPPPSRFHGRPSPARRRVTIGAGGRQGRRCHAGSCALPRRRRSRARRCSRDVARAAPLVPDGLVAGGMVDVRCGGRRLATLPQSGVARDDRHRARAACAAGRRSRRPSPGVERVALSGGDASSACRRPRGGLPRACSVVAARALTVARSSRATRPRRRARPRRFGS